MWVLRVVDCPSPTLVGRYVAEGPNATWEFTTIESRAWRYPTRAKAVRAEKTFEINCYELLSLDWLILESLFCKEPDHCEC